MLLELRILFIMFVSACECMRASVHTCMCASAHTCACECKIKIIKNEYKSMRINKISMNK